MPCPTAIAATNCVIELDNAAGTPTDISSETNKVKTTIENKIGEFRTFGNKWPCRLVISKDAAFDIDTLYTLGADDGFDILRDWHFGGNDNPRTLSIYIPNNQPGSDKYTAEVVLEKLEWDTDAEADEPVMTSASLKPTGEVLYSVVV
jgi:hypothetical protein